jgi:pilus assembly protein CpaB
MDRRKAVLIFGGAWLSAALLTWFLWAETKAPKIEKTVVCVAVTHDLPAGTRLKKADIRLVHVPDKAVPKGAIFDEASAIDRVLLFPISSNETLTSAKMTSTSRAEGLAATIDPGKRAISVQINDTSGVAGLIQPRSHVDVLFTRTGSMAEALTSTILEDIVVLSIGRATEVSQNTNIDPKASRPQNQAVTLLVTPEEARKIELAKDQGKIGLSLRNPLDRSAADESGPTRAEALDIDPASLRNGRRVPNVRDPRVWDDLTAQNQIPKREEKKEPPKPRLVVDVFRGDKHVQEIFQ